MHTETVPLDILVTRAQRGDASAIERLLQVSYPKLLRLARAVVRSDDLARDIVQETMLALTLNLDGLENPRAFDVWANQILRRRCFSYFRRRKKERLVTVVVDASAMAALAADPDQTDAVARAELMKAVELLGGRNREVVSLHYFLGLNIGEIAARVDASVGAVKVRLHRARAELRSRLVPSSPGL